MNVFRSVSRCARDGGFDRGYPIRARRRGDAPYRVKAWGSSAYLRLLPRPRFEEPLRRVNDGSLATGRDRRAVLSLPRAGGQVREGQRRTVGCILTGSRPPRAFRVSLIPQASRLAQALDHLVPKIKIARIALWTDGLSNECLPRRDRRESGRSERKIGLERLAGLRQLTGKRERRYELSVRQRIIRIDRDRLPGGIYRLIVLLQREVRPRFIVEPTKQPWIVRTESNGLVKVS